MDLLSLGLLGESGKENEYRLPIHPSHFDRIDADIRDRMLVEPGYGERYDVSDADIAAQVAALQPRAEIMSSADVVVLPKPTLGDLKELHEGQVLWGWPHCVQDAELTQLAIDQKLTLIAWEAMNRWTDTGAFDVHVFHGNNEIAGYCSVLHALSLVGRTGHYGRRMTAVVIGFGNSARGAVTALSALGVQEVTVLSTREISAVASPISTVEFRRLTRLEEDPSRTVIGRKGTGDTVPAAQFLAGFDIVVNCVLQDTDEPLMFVTDEELADFAPGSLIVDVSCDEAMGFESAIPTTFERPMITLGHGIRYYAVDHSPSYLWDSATWEISSALLPFLRPVMAGPAAWDDNLTLARAVEIRNGVIQNPKILGFQHRSPDYPHPFI
jgi:alanine dehydrogenase